MKLIKIPFGKYKGVNIEEIPDSYLVWLESVAKQDLKQSCLTEIAKRFKLRVLEETDDELDDLIGYTGPEWWKD